MKSLGLRWRLGGAAWAYQWAVLGCAAALCACAPHRLRPPEAHVPAVSQPVDLIPADLDIGLRLDLAVMRRTLGATGLARIQESAGSVRSDDREIRMLNDALDRATTAWIGFRPDPATLNTDNVMVLRGDFRRFDPSKYRLLPPFRAPQELGSAWRVFSRERPAARSSVSRVYVRDDSLLVLVSEAEIDSVERVLERGIREPHVEPSGRGDFSAEARGFALAALLEPVVPQAARLLRQAKRVRAYVDFASSTLVAEVELEFSDPDQAGRAGDALGAWAKALAVEGGTLAALLIDPLGIEAVGDRVVLRIALDEGSLAMMSTCWRDSARCGFRAAKPGGPG